MNENKEITANKQQKKRRTKKRKTVYNVIIVLLCAVLFVCLFNIGSYYLQDFSNDNMNDDLAEEFVSFNDSSASSNQASGDSSDSGGSGGSGGGKPVTVPTSIDFEKLKEQNKDVVGWIFSKNGVINYPILQGKDNSYYLNHLINGKKNINGSIFMDYTSKSDFSGSNTIIYGHSMDNGSMFRTLLNYKKQSYYDKYPEIYIYTPQGNYKMVIFAAYESNSKDKVYGKIYSETGFTNLVNYALGKSKIKTDVKVTTDDKLVTLSTCAYSSNEARFLVMGKLVPANADTSDSSDAASSTQSGNDFSHTIFD